ncbi:hypothetical protein [Rhizobium leguminosarum]|uniref:hypothetical protein n=1 Tax=Rhizobium leguminosarum TaxID=384 RepID=UPI001FEDD5C0|nr:hypothetical protein [Rhizobium leguminosarum]
MFYPFTRPEIAAALHPEFDDGRGVDVLESNLVGDGNFDTSLPDYWRYAVDGRATIIRPYREDRQRTGVAFRCTWRGWPGARSMTSGASIGHPVGMRVPINAPPSALGTCRSLNEVVAQLSCPVLSLFGLSECGAELVARLAPRFIKL